MSSTAMSISGIDWEKEIRILEKEYFKYFKIIKAINEESKQRKLDKGEKDKLEFYRKQFKSIEQELQEAKDELRRSKEV